MGRTMDDFEMPLQSESPKNDSPSSLIERRLVMRLLRIWRDKSESDDMPLRENLDLDEIADSRPFCWAATVDPASKDVRFDWIGDAYAMDNPASLIGTKLADAPEGTLIARASAYADNVITWRVPMSFGGELKHRNGQVVLFRSIIVPLRGRDNGNNVGHLLGAANYRTLT